MLFIDDDKAVLVALGRLLRNHDVTLAHGSLAGMEQLLRREPLDAVICDVSMPGLTGPALYAAILKHRPELARRFVFLSGNVDQAAALVQAHTKHHDFVPAVLEKPTPSNALLAQIEAVAA